MKTEIILLGLMNKQLEILMELLGFFTCTVVEKEKILPTMEEWLLKLMELAKIVKLTVLIKKSH